MGASKRKAPGAVPAWERGNSARQFSAPKTALPVFGEDGRVVRSFQVNRHRGKPTADFVPEVPEHAEDDEKAGPDGGVPSQPKTKKRRKSKAEGDLSRFEHDLEAAERAKAEIAALASAVMADPEGNVARLTDLRKMAATSSHGLTALVILTESQLYKDICPAYRIRALSDEEDGIKVSKEVLQLRKFEQSLLACYTRFLRSATSLSRKSVNAQKPARGSVKREWTPVERKRNKLRRAACTALCEVSRALLHFNLGPELATTVATLTTDSDPTVRAEASSALSEVLADVHRCAGPALSSRISAAECLSKAVVSGKGIAQPETIEPLLYIKFAFFTKFNSSHRDKKKEPKHFNRKHRDKATPAQADKAAREAIEQERKDRLDLERELREAQAEGTPQELFSAKKRLLRAVCSSCFNVLKTASESALSSVQRAAGGRNTSKNGGSATARPRTRKPPPALAVALEGILLVAQMLDGELLDAILEALSPILEGETLPLQIRFRTLSAAYAILAAHAANQAVDADAFTRDARSMDTCLYVALGQLYGPSCPVGLDEAVTSEASRACEAAVSWRSMPPVRAAAIGRRLGVMAAAMAPTHSCAIGLLSAVQLLLPPYLVECIYPSGKGGQDDQGGDLGCSSGLVQSYDMDASDPDTAAAEHSAAWELAALSTYFHPVVRSVSKQCREGVCGEGRPAGQTNSASLVESYSADSGGFNPPPQQVFAAPKASKRARRERSQPSDFVNSLGGKYAEFDLNGDGDFASTVIGKLPARVQ